MLLLFVVFLVLLNSWGLGEVSQTDVTYWTFNKETLNHKELKSNESIFLPTSQIIFLIHEGNNNRGVKWYSQLTKALLNKTKTDYVIQVDYSRIAARRYAEVVSNVPDVGKHIGEFIISLKIPLENVHLIGFSLGAHVASFAGKHIIAQTTRKIKRITGLDPTGPLFVTRPESKRINKNDAEVVVIIHTDVVIGFSIISCGTIDFWPNWGLLGQPGCLCSTEVTCTCNHFRAYSLFIDAILRPGTLLGRDSSKKYTLDMGGTITKDDHAGNYYLTTNKEAPYGQK